MKNDLFPSRGGRLTTDRRTLTQSSICNKGVRYTAANPRLSGLAGRFSLSEQFGGLRICRDSNARAEIFKAGALGSPDTICVIKGQFAGIEVQSGKGKQSEHQKEFQKNLEAAGGEYILAFDLDEVLMQFASEEN